MAHLGISVDEDMKADPTGGAAAAQRAPDNPVVLPVQSGAYDGTELRDAAADFGDFPQTSWEFADLDLEALSQLFFGDRDLQSLMHPLGS